MTAALTAFAGVDFRGTRTSRDLWTDPPAHVDDLNGDPADRIVAEFNVRTRAPSPILRASFSPAPQVRGRPI